MDVKIEGKTLVIRIPLLDSPKPSASGKNLTVCTTGGNVKTEALVNGKPVTIGLNCYIPAN